MVMICNSFDEQKYLKSSNVSIWPMTSELLPMGTVSTNCMQSIKNSDSVTHAPLITVIGAFLSSRPQ